jgi:hypothetical protein
MSKKNSSAAVAVSAIALGSVRLDSYNGNPTVVFGTDPNPGRNFSFGRSKACLLLDAIATHGVDAVLDMVRTVAGRDVKAEQGTTTPTVKVTATPTVKTERPDTATVATPIVQPKPAATVKTSKPKADSERKTLMAIIKAAGLRGHGLCHKWSIETLRAKAATVNMDATPTVQATATPTDHPNGKAKTVAECNATVETPAPSIVHRAAIDGMTYVLFSDGVTKQIRIIGGQERFYTTKKKLLLPVRNTVAAPSTASDVAEKTVLRTFREGSTQYVLYTDLTYRIIERKDATV